MGLAATDEKDTVFPPPLTGATPITHVRGILLTASLRALSERGHADRYYAALAPEHHATMRALIASSWVAEPVAFAHYLACDSLALPTPEVVAIGAEVGTRIKDTFLGAVFRVAREAGTTPWVFLERLPTLFSRICVGGACAAYRLGPKEARVEWYGLRGLQLAYFRTAFRGANQSIVELFCRKAYVSETKATRGGDWAFKASWV